ncbi:MAG: superfamily II DNA or RNA helicase [Myxococcota bacterium]|jgi:superfamily II DNA or RNA helicase
MTASVLNLPDHTRMLDVVRAGLNSAQDVRIAVSFARCSGLSLLIDPLKDLVDRGGQARVLTSTYMSVTQPAALDALLAIPGVSTKVQHGATGFHTKFWWFSGEDGGGGECWAGSSNLSKGGLSTNLEWNLRSVDPAMMLSTRAQFDTLWKRKDVTALSETFVRQYEHTYRRIAAQSFQPNFQFVADAPNHITPNAAQREALVQLAALRARGERRGAVIAATGVGKTYLAAFDVRQSGLRSVLYVSHRLEHLTQAKRAFRDVLGHTHSLGLVGGGTDESGSDIVFITVASLRNRPELAARHVDYLIIDEFHHAEAPSYDVLRPIREHAFLLGITATPERQDGHDVLEWCDWNVAYEVRLPEAIDRGWLLPFHYFGIADETVDFLRIPWRRLEQVQEALSVEARVDHVLKHAKELGFDGTRRATVGFCAGRKHAQYMAEAFNRRKQHAIAVLGDTPVGKREAIYQDLANVDHSLEWVFVADVMNEGVDIPAINSVLFLRPTESSTLFLQQLGRGLRLCAGTEVLTVLDFVGHHRSAWLTLEAIHAPSSGGRRQTLAEGFVIQPPSGCEVVLQRRTQEILAKVGRFKTKKAACDDAYKRLRSDLDRPVLPVDLWSRVDVPDLRQFRMAHKTWLRCQDANGDLPLWAIDLAGDHPVHAFLKAAEADWQAQRVWPYALLWGLCAFPDDPESGFEAFFRRWPHHVVEYASLDDGKAWQTVQKKLGPALVEGRLAPAIRQHLGDSLLYEVEGRIMYTMAQDHHNRHGGMLRTPDDLHLFAEYGRPEIIRHFGVHYDPAKHNTGMLWFADQGVIITKLNTSGAIERHHYANQLSSADRFLWTSQNRMSPDNSAGKRVTKHSENGSTLHLFVQPRSHTPAVYLGCVQMVSAKGSRPMQVTFDLKQTVPDEVMKALGVDRKVGP